jgi:hypothetical protein
VKRKWKRSPRKSYELRQRFARQCARAEELRHGSQGAASGVRHIDPTSYVPPPPKRSVIVPKSAAQMAAEQRDKLDLQASRLTGMRRIAKKQIFRSL